MSFKKNKKEKEKILEENIKNLEDLSNKIQQTINELKIMLETIDKNKKEFKTKIKAIFTKLRNELNKREDELLLETDKFFEEMFFDEKIVEKCEKLPQEIKICLEKGKKINDEWKDKDKLSSIINDCINIENTIKDINYINDKIENYKKKKNYEVKLKPNEDQLEEDLNIFKNYGKIYFNEEEKNEVEIKNEEEKKEEKK